MKLNIGKDMYLKGRIGWKGLSKNEYLDKSEYKIINATALNDGLVDYEKCGYISKERFLESEDIIVKNNDILISKDGTLGKIGYVKNLKEKLTVASGIFILRNSKIKELNMDYLYHIIKSDIFKNFINKKKALGSTINHLYQRDLEQFEIDIPDLKQQTSISNILNQIELKMDINNRIIMKLESMMKDIYDYWFVQFDFPNEKGKPYKSSGGKMVYNEKLKRGIPAIFEIKTVEDFCDIFTGKKDVNKSLDNGKYKFFSCAPEFRYSNEYLYDGKAILVSGNGSYTGRTIFVNDKFDLYQRTYAIVNKDDAQDIIEYIYLSLKTYFVLKVKGGTHGSAIPYIVYNDIANEPILYNKEIIMKFIDIVKQLLQKIVAIKNQNDKLKEYKNFILPLLMNGQVEVK